MLLAEVSTGKQYKKLSSTKECLMKKEHYYGTLKIVDRAFNTEVEGSGLFFPDDGKVYVRLQKATTGETTLKEYSMEVGLYLRRNKAKHLFR